MVPFICRDMVSINENQEGRMSVFHEDLDGIVLIVTERHSSS